VFEKYFEGLYYYYAASQASGESYWLHIQKSGFDSWRYQIFCLAAGQRRLLKGK
jgi:hypothetical protein